jgi:hypothetical protein
MSQADGLCIWAFAFVSDVVLYTISDREYEVIHYHLPQLRSFMYLFFIF